ncbi:hypothetical protein DVH24_037704 [Malus domestica]|uniref:Enoyl reductase (ER) domain-containing protein n=1 Tax=Malus domestica TaxID=3750 RepID=A0A498IXA5_MALDO|nr:hypothetical protein DVH24_037704 [Malus domestica]
MGESPEQHPKKAFGWAARDSSGVLSPFKFSRRDTGKNDLTFKVLYCGICHTDLHMIKNEWGNSIYTKFCYEHEIVGVVTEIGTKVEKFKVGDHVDNLPLDGAAPLLCAGVTTYSPLRYFGLDKPGMHVGVVGVGGIGHVAVKFAKAMGVKVTVINTSPTKKDDAIENLGADSFLVSREEGQMQGAMGTMDGILDTVSAVHPLLPLVGLLKSHGKLVLLGAPDKPLQLPVFPLLMGRKMIAGSCRWRNEGDPKMIDFATKHNITANVEVIPVDYANTAMEGLIKANVRCKFCH